MLNEPKPTYQISYLIPSVGFYGSVTIDLNGHLLLPDNLPYLLNELRETAAERSKAHIEPDADVVIISIYRFEEDTSHKMQERR